MEVLTGIRGNCSDTCIRAKITQGKTLHDWICSFRRNMIVGVDNNDSRIDAWIYGHSHTNIDTEIGSTKVICNQMGYVFENEHVINGFDPGEFLTI